MSEGRSLPVISEGVEGVSRNEKWGFKSVYPTLARALPVGDPIILLQISVMNSVALQPELCRTTMVSRTVSRSGRPI